MNAVRHVFATVLVVCLPPAIVFWLVVHPFAQWWRRLDARITYAILIVFATGLGTLLFVFREPLLGRDLGTSKLLVGIGVVLGLMSALISLLCRKHLTLKILTGMPEVSPNVFPGQLLQEGIFGVIRHPRYLSVILGTSACAAIAGYSGAYAVGGISLIGLWPVIVLEERELAARFGPAYAAYRSRGPALVPRLRQE